MKKYFLFPVLLLFSVNAWASFPTTPVLDSFDRANENPLSDGGKWTTYPSEGQLKIVSDQCVVKTVSTISTEYWNVATYTNVEVYFTVNTILTTTNDNMAAFVRLSTSSFLGYFIEYLRNTSSGDSIILYVFNTNGLGGVTALATYSQHISAGDSIGLSDIGTTLTVYYKSGAGSWTVLGSVNDSTYTTGNYIGFGMDSTSATSGVINFGGGNAQFGDFFQVM